MTQEKLLEAAKKFNIDDLYLDDTRRHSDQEVIDAIKNIFGEEPDVWKILVGRLCGSEKTLAQELADR